MSIAKKPKSRPAAHVSAEHAPVSRVRRLRRQPEEVRTAALESARKLLLAQGPDAITLKAVGDDLGMTHTNLIHHFGSAEGLQSTLMREMVSNLTATMENAVARYRSGAGDVREFVDIVFDAFDKGGAGRLIAWLMVSGNAKLFAPVAEVVRTYLAHIEEGAHVDAAQAADLHRRFTTSMLFMVITAFGDAIIGDEMRKMVGRERHTVRDVARDFLPLLSPLVRERQTQS
jgi:TetR/AcrR family transcriptional regulator, repressor for neighboring sulfatase